MFASALAFTGSVTRTAERKDSVSFFSLGGEAGAAKGGKAERAGASERRAPNSPMRGMRRDAPAAAPRHSSGAGTGTNGNFRPY